MWFKTGLSIFAFVLISTEVAAQQGGRLGVNLAPWRTGTPELMLDLDLSGVLGVTLSGGLVSTNSRCCTKDLDGIDDYHLKGEYLKAGFTYHPFGRHGKGDLFLQARYVASFYRENAVQWVDDGFAQSQVDVSTNGLAHGLAFTFGVDADLYRRLGLRAGLQVGHFKRTDYLGSLSRTVQPGLGAHTGFRSQLLLGLWYRVGER